MLWCQWQNTKSLRNVALTFGQLFHEQTAMNNLQKVIVLVVISIVGCSAKPQALDDIAVIGKSNIQHDEVVLQFGFKQNATSVSSDTLGMVDDFVEQNMS